MSLEVALFPCLSDNYGFLLHDPETGETAAIDTPDAREIAKQCEARSWTLTEIWNTHWHPDHAGGHVMKHYQEVISSNLQGIALMSSTRRGTQMNMSSITFRRQNSPLLGIRSLPWDADAYSRVRQSRCGRVFQKSWLCLTRQSSIARMNIRFPMRHLPCL